MKIPLRKALWLAVGPANVDAAGHAVADWFDGHNCSGAADLIREHLQDQQGGDAVPHNRPDTSLRSELMAKLATQREVLLNLCDRVDRLEMRADGLTPIERVERRWAKETAGGDKLDWLIAQDKEADGPAVSEDREPADVVGQPTDDELASLWVDAAHIDQVHGGIKFARAVLARWGHQPAPQAEGEVGELMVSLRRASDGASAMGWEQDARTIARAAELLQQRHPEPVPISERLPGPEDCDGDGRCWLFSKVEKEWRLLDVGNPGVPHLRYCFSHSLPATALPLPSSTSPNKAND